jgi:hypothetical protein
VGAGDREQELAIGSESWRLGLGSYLNVYKYDRLTERSRVGSA